MMEWIQLSEDDSSLLRDSLKQYKERISNYDKCLD